MPSKWIADNDLAADLPDAISVPLRDRAYASPSSSRMTFHDSLGSTEVIDSPSRVVPSLRAGMTVAGAPVHGEDGQLPVLPIYGGDRLQVGHFAVLAALVRRRANERLQNLTPADRPSSESRCGRPARA